MNVQGAPARAVEAVSLEVEGETLVYQRQTGEVHRLDPVGAIVWRLLDGQSTVDELVDDLAAAFEVDAGVVRGDVGALLARLEEARLLASGAPHERPDGPVLLTNPPSP